MRQQLQEHGWAFNDITESESHQQQQFQVVYLGLLGEIKLWYKELFTRGPYHFIAGGVFC